MDKNYTYCRGIRCLLRTNCKRYLIGQRHYLEEDHEWIESCDEEDRSLFDPERAS